MHSDTSGVGEDIVLAAIQASGLFWLKAVELQQVRVIISLIVILYP